jgi:undecaprenyl-diphosphatase
VLELDRDVAEWIVEHRVGWLNWLFEGLSYIGTWGAVWLAIGLALAVLRRRPELFLLAGVADAVAQLAAIGLKHAAGRHRPHLHPLVSVPTDRSFPSGHAASSFACAAVLAFLAPRLAAPLFLLAAAIAFSRVYVGVHYPLDVLGGAVLGLAVATALLLLARGRRRSRPAPTAG